MLARRHSQARARQISSAANPLVKIFRRALAEGTTGDGWLAIEGPHLLEEALKVQETRRNGRGVGGPTARNLAIRSVLVSESGARKFAPRLESLSDEVEIAQVPDRVFAGVSQVETPAGVAALVELPRYDLESALGPRALLVVACGLQNAGNLGTILRSAQALGASAVVTLPGTVSPFNPKAVRASAGSAFGMPVFPGLEAHSLWARLRRANVRIVATDRRSLTPITGADFQGPLALLVGREGSGLEEAIARQADLGISIPIRSGTDSVNAAVAAGIVLYEVARQRGFDYGVAQPASGAEFGERQSGNLDA